MSLLVCMHAIPVACAKIFSLYLKLSGPYIRRATEKKVILLSCPAAAGNLAKRHFLKAWIRQEGHFCAFALTKCAAAPLAPPLNITLRGRSPRGLAG